jgi:hypothetical protein
MNAAGGWVPVQLALLTLLCISSAPASPATAQADSGTAGESIYRRGELVSGATLEGSRDAQLRTLGADAACVNCHQRSGLGTVEGRVKIPPITGRYLFQPRVNSTLPYVEAVRGNREPYTEETLARAIREGIDSDGKPLSYLMPRYALDEADMAGLIGYLKSLDQRQVPGVTDSVLHFATIITPDADPARSRGVLDVIEHYFAEQNSFQTAPSRRLQASSRTMSSETMFMVHRRWQLHEWLLTGPASSWQEQLKQHMAHEPVLAVVSGLGGVNWKPVHDFCEQQHVPCLFPNVELPVDEAGDFYSLYLSRGLELEADLIAARVAESVDKNAGSAVQQIYRAGDSGEAAARDLATALNRRGFAVRNHTLGSESRGHDVARAVRETAGAPVLVLWLRAADIASLGDAPGASTAVFMSGLMAGLEQAPLPRGWRERTQVAYPVDLPERRVVRVDYPLGWFSIQHIPIVDQKVQVDTYLACGLMAENLSHMVDTFVPDYLIERMQQMLEHRVLTGYYPHLTLATSQHFASKGGYLVHFADPSGSHVVADGDWLVP